MMLLRIRRTIGNHHIDAVYLENIRCTVNVRAQSTCCHVRCISLCAYQTYVVILITLRSERAYCMWRTVNEWHVNLFHLNGPVWPFNPSSKHTQKQYTVYTSICSVQPNWISADSEHIDEKSRTIHSIDKPNFIQIHLSKSTFRSESNNGHKRIQIVFCAFMILSHAPHAASLLSIKLPVSCSTIISSVRLARHETVSSAARQTKRDE